MSTDTIDLIRFLFCFTSAIRGRGNHGRDPGDSYLPYRLPHTSQCGDLGRSPMRHGRDLIIAPHRRVTDVLIDGRCWCCVYVRNIVDLVVVLILIA
jgi:hypothetical protein